MLSGFMLARVSDRTSSQKGKVSKLRLSMIVIYFVMLLGSALLLFIDADDDYQRSIYLSFVNVGIGASVVAVNVTAVILVPHNHLANVILAMTLLSNLVSALAPVTAYGFKQPVPLYVMAGCAAIGMTAPCFMTYRTEHDRDPTDVSVDGLNSPRQDSEPADVPEVISITIDQ